MADGDAHAFQARFGLRELAYDRHFIKTFEMQCAEEGVRLPLKEFGQGYVSFSPTVQAFEAAVLDRRLHHDGHPILRWQISNVAIERVASALNRRLGSGAKIAQADLLAL